MRVDLVKRAGADQRTSTFSCSSFLSDSRALEILEVSVKKGNEQKVLCFASDY